MRGGGAIGVGIGAILELSCCDGAKAEIPDRENNESDQSLGVRRTLDGVVKIPAAIVIPLIFSTPRLSSES